MANYTKPTEEWIQSTMKTLDLTREEALEMWCDDHDIDMGKAKEFDLDPAKQKVVKEMTKAGGKRTSYSLEGAKKRERKPNDEKREIMARLFDFLQDEKECAMVNPERQIDFYIGENHYSITLTQHRKKKE
jgi:hypothetical protein